jgi:hypothetical protein
MVSCPAGAEMQTDGRRNSSGQPRLARAAIAGQATFAGCLAMVDVDRQALRSNLPPAVALSGADSPTHPCLLAFGEQTNGTTFFGGLPLPWAIRYHELMVAIPFVRWHGAAGEHLFVSGMTCDFWPAVWNGNVYYGFRKRFAQMSWDREGFSVAGDDRGPGFRAVITSPRPAGNGALDWIRSAAALSVLGHREDRAFVSSRFEWDFDEATVEAITLDLDFGPRFRELPLDIQSSCDHACRVREMRWRLSWPTTVQHRT